MIEAFAKLRQFGLAFEQLDMRLQEAVGKPTCVSGCGRCCTIPSCMIIESMNAVSTLMGEGKLTKAVAIAEGWLLERHSEAPSYEGMLAGCFVPPKIKDEFAALAQLPCPFLTETKECSVYSARPLTCRAFGVTRSSMGICNRAPGKGETLSQFNYVQAPRLRAEIDKFRVRYHEEHKEWVTYSFFPTLLLRAANEKKFRELVNDNRIATAKIIGTEIDQTLMWQPQLSDDLKNRQAKIAERAKIAMAAR